MADTSTPYLGLVKPEVGASRSTWGQKWNSNADALDSNSNTHNGQIATLQSQVATLQSQMQTALGRGAPIGAIFPWPNFGNYPGGYLLCDGSTQPVASYPALYGVIGNVYGGDSVNFGMPDFRGLVLTGWDGGSGRNGGLIAEAPGAIGGAAYVGLSIAQMPAHQHDGATDGQGDHSHGYDGFSIDAAFAFGFGNGATVNTVGRQTGGAGLHWHNISTNATGGGQGHPNLQPSVVVAWIIRAS